MKKPKAVIYDNDGMITHGVRFSDKYSKEFSVDITSMSPFFEGPFKKCLIGGADLKEELEKVLEVWKWKGTADELMQYWFATGEDLYEDVYASISKLRKQGLVVCLATNNERYRVQHLIKKLSYDKIFNQIFFSADLGVYKHSPEGLEKIFQSLREQYAISDKGEIMYWDDREDHVEILNAEGFNGQLYRDYPSFRSVLSDSGYQI